MSDKPYLLGIDQGSSGSRALILDREGQVRGYGYRPLESIYPHPGWVEHDPASVVAGVAEAVTEAIERASCRPSDIVGCGIACQRNTDFVWDAQTGHPVANAISWQDLRTLPILTELTAWPLADQCRRRLGYAPGPYSSALHLAWRMRHDSTVMDAAKAGRLRLGLSAAWLLTAMGNPSGHQMDYSLVQAMGLYDFRAQRYWDEWLDFLKVPRDSLPMAAPTIHDFGTLGVTAPNGTTANVPVTAMIGNEQAGLFGHDCRNPGDAECTHGTASFVDVFMGSHAPDQDKINVYFAWHLGDAPTYCLEADTTVSGAVIRWMREEAQLFDHDDEVGQLAASVPDSAGVVFVPAFTGLNVPYNDRNARGTILGLTLGSSRAHIARAFLESLGYQVRAILDTIYAETGLRVERLHLGGGICTSDEACQIMADQLGIPTARPTFTETAARAAALLAGLGVGIWTDVSDLPPLPGGFTLFESSLSAEQREANYARWKRAVDCVRSWGQG
ncbi:MAG: FGGY family carbohydrate kinase [Anaerolineae bacterium]|nr:FGGY family carbohydrate kinase [Anaerolineae bacterium]